MAEKKKVKPPVEQLVDADARKKALKMALDQISKQFGKDAILSMGSQPDQNLDVVSTGSFGPGTRRRRSSPRTYR
jgi:recombination protein RecA